MSAAMVEVSSAEFAVQVLDVSRNIPVVVDFWAPWCGPCRALSPVLEKLAAEYAGKVSFVKVNSDQNQEVAAQFGVRSIPNVKAFAHGKVVSEFAGVIPESAIRKFLDKLIPSPGEKQLAVARQLITAGEPAGAETLLRDAIAAEPSLNAARVELAGVLSGRGDFDDAERILADVPEAARDEHAEQIRMRIEQWKAGSQLPAAEVLEDALKANPGDLAIRMKLGERYAADACYEVALGQFIEVVEKGRGTLREAARQAMLSIFTLAANDAGMISPYRRRLASALN